MRDKKAEQLAGWDPENTLLRVSLRFTLCRLANISSKSLTRVLGTRDLMMMSSTYGSAFLPSYGPNAMCIIHWKVAPALLSPKGMQV